MKAFIALFLVAFLCASVYAQGQVTVFTIDDFVEDSPALFIVATGTSQTQSNFVVDPSIVGGERDLQLTSLTGKNQVLSASVSGGEFNSAAPKGATGLALLQYDGEDNTVTLDPNGLADDFTVSGAFAFRTNITADLPTTVFFRVYSGSVSSFCEYALAIPGNGQSKFYTLRYVDFNDTGSGCNFKNVGALEVQADLPDSVDVTIAVIEVVANPSATPTRTRTRTPSPVPVSPSRTRTPTPTRTRTPTPIPASPSNTRTPTRTRTPTPIPASPSNTRTPTPTRTRTPTPIPASPSNTRTRTPTPSRIPPSPSNTRTRTPTPSRIPDSPSRTRTPTPTRTRTPTPSRIPASPSRTPSPSNCICTCPELECFMFKYGEYSFKGNQGRNIENVEVQQANEEGFDFLKFF